MKRPISLVIGIIILVLSIVGFSSYFKNHPIKIGKIGFGGSGSDGEIGTTKGDYLLCSGSESGGTEDIYMEFKNDIISEIAIGKISYPYTDELKQRYSKEEIEKELLKEFCSSSIGLYNCNISWDGDNIVAVGNIKIPDDYKGLSRAETQIKMEKTNSNIKCANTTKAPKVSGSIDPYTNAIQNEQTKDESVNRIPETENQTTTSNSHKKFCLDWNASGGSDVSLSFVFYCDKNVVQKSVDVSISANFNENTLFGKNSGNYTIADAEKEFRNRYCNKIKDCNISWDKNKRTITLKGTCKSNYAGLSKSTVEEFRNDWEITTALNEICE
jgi:hypothetical protein